MFTIRICPKAIISIAILLFLYVVPLHSQNKSITIKDTMQITPSARTSSVTLDESACPYDSVVRHRGLLSQDIQTQLIMPTDGMVFARVVFIYNPNCELFVNGEEWGGNYSEIKKYGPFTAGTPISFRMHMPCAPDVIHDAVYYHSGGLHFEVNLSSENDPNDVEDNCIEGWNVTWDVAAVNVNHFELEMPTEINYGGTGGIYTNIVDDDGELIWPSFFCQYWYEIPPEIPLTITAEPSGYGHFETEETVGDSGAFQFTLADDLYYVADGIQPDSAQTITFTVASVDDPGKTGTGTIVIQRPNCPKVVLSKEQINPGDTIDVTMKKKFEDGTEQEYPAGTKFYMEIFEGAEYGSFVLNGEPSSWLDEVEMPVQFVAAEAIGGDSVIATIWGEVVTSGGGVSTRMKARGDTTGRAVSQVVRKEKTVGSAVKQPAANALRSRKDNRAMNQFECGEPVDTVVIKKKSFEILLGESKYYYVVQKDDLLFIHETANPSLPTSVEGTLITDASVWSSNPVTTVKDKENSGKRLGVYWETQKPKPVGSGNIPDGMIRLIGRYWTADSIYKVTLAANYSGKSGSITIEVKKPSKLGNDYGPLPNNTRRTSVSDVYNQAYNLDSIIIFYAGKYGIPPQILKADMQQEGNFQPAYRWEPFVDAVLIQNERSRYMDDDFRYKKTATSEGQPGVPTTHTNVYPIQYPQNDYSTIWERFFQQSRTLNPNAGVNRYPKGLWYSYPAAQWTKRYNTKLNALLTKKVKSTDAKNQATTYANEWLRDRYRNGIMSEGIAQTRSAVSYGLMQMLYSTAIDNRGYPFDRTSGEQNHLPEYLNITDTNLTYAIPFLLSKIKAELVTQGDGGGKTSNWTLGYEKTIVVALNMYNGKTARIASTEYPDTRYNWHYGFDVMVKVYQYLPQK